MIRMAWVKGVQTLSKVALAAALVAQGVVALASTELKIPTSKGFVAFSVEGDWPVLSMQMKPPIASAAFRIPNPADARTHDSSNILIVLYETQSAEARAAFKTPVKQYGSARPKAQVLGPWTVYRQAAVQGDTHYTIVDAKRRSVSDVPDIAMGVRMVWPHLAGNAADYDAHMEAVLKSVLDSIHGGPAATP
jgi:hypothetical protein